MAKPRRKTPRRKQAPIDWERIKASIPSVAHLPDDPEQEAIEQKMARHFMRRLPPPEPD